MSKVLLEAVQPCDHAFPTQALGEEQAQKGEVLSPGSCRKLGLKGRGETGTQVSLFSQLKWQFLPPVQGQSCFLLRSLVPQGNLLIL